MIAFHALLSLLPPSALTLAGTRFSSGDAPPLGEIRETVLEHLRQIKADLAGDPQRAEQIYRIVSSTITA
ncbi:MAG: hypothetical protein ABSD21_00520 [Rhizomicrobium sp.]